MGPESNRNRHSCLHERLHGRARACSRSNLLGCLTGTALGFTTSRLWQSASGKRQAASDGWGRTGPDRAGPTGPGRAGPGGAGRLEPGQAEPARVGPGWAGGPGQAGPAGPAGARRGPSGQARPLGSLESHYDPTMAQLWPNYGPTMAQPMTQLRSYLTFYRNRAFAGRCKKKERIFFVFFDVTPHMKAFSHSFTGWAIGWAIVGP